MRPPFIVPMNKNKTNKWIEKHFLNREIFAINISHRKRRKLKKRENILYNILEEKLVLV